MLRAVGRFKNWFRHPALIWQTQDADHLVSVEIRNWLPYPLVIILLTWYIAAPSITIALCLATVVAVLAGGYTWARQMASNLRGKRVLQYSAMQVGDVLEEQVTLTNESLLPAIWIEIRDHSNLPEYALSGVRGVGGSGRVSWRPNTICTKRGVYQLGPWEIRTGDPFGLFVVQVVTQDSQEVLVYPPLAILPEEWFPHRGAQGDSRPLRQPLRAETIDGMSVREYVTGDPLRHIHWPTTARHELPYVKVFAPQAASRFWIIPDLDPAYQLGIGNESTEETTILLAASIAAKFLDEKLRVGLFVGGHSPTIVTPQHGNAHLWNLLSALAPLHPQPDWDLSSGIAQFQPLISQRDVMVIITSAAEENWIDNLRKLMRDGGRAPARIFLLDPESFGGQLPAEPARQALAGLGIETRVVKKGEIQAISGVYGALSRWEFVTSATGKAHARKTPRQAAFIFAGQRDA